MCSKFKFIIAVLFLTNYAISQPVFLGITSAGSGGAGTIFKTNPNGNTYESLYSYAINRSGTDPGSSVPIQIGNKVYATMRQGGFYNNGVIFSYDLITNTYTAEYHFRDTTSGSAPSNLLHASNGLLYGMTASGGTAGDGVLYSFNPANSQFTKLLNFNGTNGSAPKGKLIQATDGNIYGVTEVGGANSRGVLFRYVISTNTYSVLYQFNNDGRNPKGGIMQALNGKLYGLAFSGGANGTGVLYEFDYSTNTYTKHVDFSDTTNGRYPVSDLTEAPNGKLYGVTTSGGINNDGALFSFNTSTNTLIKHHNFSFVTGSKPECRLTALSNGILYGVTTEGGFGKIFSFNSITNAYSMLNSFGPSNPGTIPIGGLLYTTSGDLIGITSIGGFGNNSVLYKYSISSNVFTSYFYFNDLPGGGVPKGRLLKTSDGNYFGFTSIGGLNGFGTIFKYNPVTNTYTTIINLASATGYDDGNSMVQASNGIIYGLHRNGGTTGQGSIFSLNPITNTYTILHNFSVTTDGGFPVGGLVPGAGGKFYGVTFYGGVNSVGTIYSYDINTSTFAVHANFSNGVTTGHAPMFMPMLSSSGKLYGTTSNGGANNRGTLYMFNINTNILTKVYDFTSATGFQEFSELIEFTDGKLYGTSRITTSPSGGMIYSFDTTSAAFNIVYSFPSSGLNSPVGRLTLATDNKLYGYLASNSTNTGGSIFQYDIAMNQLNNYYNFDLTTGGKPDNSGLTELSPIITTSNLSTANNCTGSNINVNFTVSVLNFNSGNIFTAQLSSDSGSFASPVNIGTLSGTTSGTINCIIPANIIPGPAYKIRVVGSNPAVIGSETSAFQISNFVQSFIETMGSVSGTTAIAAHESANGFDNDSWTMSGNADIRNTIPSFGYPGFSGGANVFITTTVATNFLISNINTTGKTNISLSFGVNKSVNNNNGSQLTVEVSSDGVSYTPLSFALLPTGAGTASTWYNRTATGTIPSTSNLRLRFRQTGTQAQYRIDDIVLSMTDTAAGITSTGTTVCNSSSVTLNASLAPAYSWSNSTTGSSTNVSTVGDYFCNLTSANGCIKKSNTITITDLTPEKFNMTGTGAYCSDQSGTILGLDGSETGVNYQLLRNGLTTVGSPIAGNGNPFSFGLQSIAGSYSVNATSTATGGCSVLMEDTIIVSVINTQVFYADNDGDNYGTYIDSIVACFPTGIYTTTTGGDCADNNAAINPGAIEIPGDFIDQDCNGGDVCFTDVDNDNFGTNVIINSSDLDCTDLNEAPVSGDCNDGNASINPLATEIPADGIDQDCNGGELCYTDLDNDNYGIPTTIVSADLDCNDLNEGNLLLDCNDANAAIRPGATEIPGDGIDQDCSGGDVCFTDIDNDNYGTNVTINSVDLDCADLNEAPVTGDCDDNNAAVNPLAAEICNGIDDDCEGTIDSSGCPLAGIYCIGPSASYTTPSSGLYRNSNAPYPTITAAMADLNTKGASTHVIFELQNNYVSTSETFPIIVNYEGTPSTTITLRPRIDVPATLTIAGSASSGTILFDFVRADYFTFTGYPGGVTATNSILIRNLYTASTAGANIRFRDDAMHNTINGLNIEGGFNANRCIHISGTVFSNGNDFTTIQNCLIRNRSDISTFPPNTGIECSGLALTGNTSNSTILIQGNQFNNVQNGIKTTNSANGSWNVTGNHFYFDGTTAQTSLGNPINVSNASDTLTVTISGNYIGGSGPFATGVTLNTVLSGFNGIQVNTALNSNTAIISGNTISGFNISPAIIGFYSFNAITAYGGAMEITDNIIGSMTNPNDITFSANAELIFTAISSSSTQNNRKIKISRNKVSNITSINSVASTPLAFSIIAYYNQNLLVDSAIISDNQISNFNYAGQSDVYAFNLKGGTAINAKTIITRNVVEGITLSNSAIASFTGLQVISSPSIISGNRIGKLSGINNIAIARKGSSFGIRVEPDPGSTGEVSITQDSVLNVGVSQADISCQFTCIYFSSFSSSAGAAHVDSNYIYSCSTASGKSNLESDPSGFAFTGIHMNSTNNSSTISGNIINTILGMNTSSANPVICGINILGLNPVIVASNSIYQLTNTALSSASLLGIKMSASSTLNLRNNMISLDNLGNPNDVNLYGIYDNGSGFCFLYYNSVRISGSSSSGRSGAYWRNGNAGLRQIKNNIFFNTRTGSGSNYAIMNQTGSVSWGTTTSDYNNLYASDSTTVGGWPLGVPKTFAAWKTTSGGDLNSRSRTVSFVSPFDLHLNPSANCYMESAGTFVAPVTIDFDGDTRNATTPDMGADEFTSTIVEICGNNSDDDCDGLVDENCVANVTVKLFIEGFYLIPGSMNPSIDPINQPLDADSIIVELHDSIAPYNTMYSSTGILDVTGNCNLTFPPAAIGSSYYITIKHRNTLETWSKNPVLISTSTTYNFKL